MSATITILYNEKEESIQMEVQPDENLEDILERCMDYWMLRKDKERYVFLKRNDELDGDETVISAGIEKGDVLSLDEKRDLRGATEKKSKTPPLDNADINPVTAAKNWLEKNIGLEPPRLTLVTEEDRGESVNLVFRITGKEKYLTVQVKNGEIRDYIPRESTLKKG